MGGYSESEGGCAEDCETICVAVFIIHWGILHAKRFMSEYIEKEINISFNLWERWNRRRHLAKRLEERLCVYDSSSGKVWNLYCGGGPGTKHPCVRDPNHYSH